MSEKVKNNKKAKNGKKQKTTGFDIMYRVVTAILAIAVFPVTYFMNLVYYALDWTSVMNLIGNFQNIFNSESIAEGIKNFLTPTTGNTMEISDGYICLAKLDEFKSLLNTASSGKVDFKEVLLHNVDLRPLVISLALFAVVLVLAIVILIVAIAGKNKAKLISVISSVAIAFSAASYVVFTSFFAAPLINGEKTLSEILSIESLGGSIFTDVLGKVIELRFDNAFFTVLFLMIGILIWSLSVMIVNSDDKSEKALREAKKAEKAAKKKAKQAKKEAKKAEKAVEEVKKIAKEEKAE